MRSQRPAWRAHLLLARVSNLPTVWTNVLAGMTVAAAVVSTAAATYVAIAMSLMYCGGMYLNDAFDARIDARQRPDRPVPNGDVARATAFTVGFVLLAAGFVLVGRLPSPGVALLCALALAAAITIYNAWHKANPFGPLVMGLCRGLVYCVAAAVAVRVVAAPVLVAGVVMVGYVLLLTVVAKQAGPSAGRIVPVMLAGISLVDAVVIAIAGGGALAVLGVVGFVLTLALQRVVPGT